MSRKPYRYEVLRDYLRKQPGMRATVRQIHVEAWIQNVPDAAMAAKKNGIDIRTEYDEKNPKIAYYVLYEDEDVEVVQTVFPDAKNGEVVSQVQAFETDELKRSRAYE